MGCIPHPAVHSAAGVPGSAGSPAAPPPQADGVRVERVDLERPIRRIVVFRANNVGDFVEGTPALRALRAAFPDAEISLVCARRVRPLAERLPWVDRVLEFPGFPGIRERAIDPRASLRFLVEAQAARYDLALQLHGNGVWSNPFVALLGAAVNVGFVRAEDSPEFMGLDRSLVYPAGRHEALRLLDLLGSIGIEPLGVEPEVFVCSEDEAEAVTALVEAGFDPRSATAPAGGRAGASITTARDRVGPLVGLHPGGRFPDRIWPAERFAEVARALVRNHGARVLLTGSGADATYTAATCAAAGVPIADLTDRVSLPGLAALIARLDLFVSNDTGPAHLAYATRTPSVTLFGAAPAAEWGSLDRERHPGIEPPPAGSRAPDDAGGTFPIQRIEPAAVLRHAGRLLALPARGATSRRDPPAEDRALAVPQARPACQPLPASERGSVGT